MYMYIHVNECKYYSSTWIALEPQQPASPPVLVGASDVAAHSAILWPSARHQVDLKVLYFRSSESDCTHKQ